MRQANTGLVEGSTVMTLSGAKAVQDLRAGDRVITRSGAMVLRDIEMRTERHARLVRISASALGNERPDEDITVAADQPILVRDWRAQALAGSDRAMIPAARLADGEYIRAEARRDIRVYRLCFDAPAVIYAQGLEFGCDMVAVPA
jgi:hypothetical protein